MKYELDVIVLTDVLACPFHHDFITLTRTRPTSEKCSNWLIQLQQLTSYKSTTVY
jgi:hypothetical protein